MATDLSTSKSFIYYLRANPQLQVARLAGYKNESSIGVLAEVVIGEESEAQKVIFASKVENIQSDTELRSSIPEAIKNIVRVELVG